MAQCQECGCLCGTRHSASMWGGYYCDDCYEKHQSNAMKCIGGIIFLCIAAVLTGVVALLLLKPITASVGYSVARGTAIGIGIGGCIGYFVFRNLAGKTSGCLTRAFFKLVGFLVYALGVGMLIVSIFCNDQLKSCCGVEEAAQNSEISD